MAGWLRWSLADALAIDLMSATAMNASISAMFSEEVIGRYYPLPTELDQSPQCPHSIKSVLLMPPKLRIGKLGFADG